MANHAPLILGIDIGTSSVKVAIVTHAPKSHVEASFGQNYTEASELNANSFQTIGLPGEHIQDPGKIFESLHIALSNISPSLMSRVNAISVTGQMHGIMGWLGDNLAFVEQLKVDKRKLVVNVDGGGCGNLVTWLDRRCTTEFLEGLPYPTRSEKPFSGFGCATLIWEMDNRPGEFALSPFTIEKQHELYQMAAASRKASEFGDLVVRHAPWTCIGTVADFLVAGLASLRRPVMSPQMAMSWGYFDSVNNSWDYTALNATGYSLSHLLPEVVPCGTPVGQLTFDWQGIPSGAEVFVALGDLQCSVYPFLQSHEDEKDASGTTAACNMSTSAQIAFKVPQALITDDSTTPLPSDNSKNVLKRLLKSNRIAIWPYFGGEDRIVVAASLNGGNVIEHFVKTLHAWCHQLGCTSVEQKQIYTKLTQLFNSKQQFQTPEETSREIYVDTRLFGERFAEKIEEDEEADDKINSASVTNIHPDNTLDLASIYGAICRGVVHNLVALAPPELLAWAHVDRLFCVGGALEKNPSMLEQLKEEYACKGIRCILNECAVEASVGAALYTASLPRRFPQK